MIEVYPVGTEVKNVKHTDHIDGSTIYGEVIEKGPSHYGTTELPSHCMFIALKREATNARGETVPAGTIFVGTSVSWAKVSH